MPLEISTIVTGVSALVYDVSISSLVGTLQGSFKLFSAIKLVEENKKIWTRLANLSFQILQTLVQCQSPSAVFAQQADRLQQFHNKAYNYVTDLQSRPKIERLYKGRTTRANIEQLCRELDLLWQSAATALSISAVKRLKQSDLSHAIQDDQAQEEALLAQISALLSQEDSSVLGLVGIYLDMPDWKIRQTTAALMALAEDSSSTAMADRIVKPLLAMLQRLSSVARSMKPEPWRIPANAVTNRSPDPVARGGFGQVYIASYYGLDVAVKELLCSYDEKEIGEFRREIYIWHKLSHTNILPLLGACDTADRPFMVSPFMRNGTLRRFISDPENRRPLSDKLQLMFQVASGMAYLHDHHIIHGDLKPLNVLLDTGLRAVISDFGMARTKHTSISASIGKHNESIGGTLDYMAPEMLDDEKPVDSTKKTDVYAFAITLFEVINNGNRVWVTVDGKPMRPSAIERHVCKGSRPKRLEGVPDEIWSLIEQCWHQSPSERPKFAEILTSLDPYKDPNPAVDTLSNIISSSPPSSILSSPTHTFDLAKPTVDLETGNDFLCLQPGCPDRSLSPCSVQSDADLDSFPGVPASLQQLCKQGDPKACMQAAKAITEAKLASDPAWGHAARLFRAAANHGSPEAKFHLAWLSLAGIGTEQSDAEALALWQQIHDTSNDAEIKPISTFLLGWLCYLGRGSQQQNKEKGIVLMRQSKTNDFTLAEDSLEPESDPVSSNSVVAQLFFRLCLLGSEQDWLCKHLEAVCHIGGFGTAKDQAMAADLFDSLANQGHDVSQHWLGRCYGWGWGVPRNDPMSFNWYSQAASQHNSYAQSMVGRCYRNGWGVAKDDVKAVEWYTKSAEQGNAVAQWNLGRCYEHGTGVAVDMERAVLWYEKAADRGLTAARHRAQRIKDQRRV